MRRQTPKRKIKPDPKFGNITVAKFINHVMRKGKKSVATQIVYSCFEIISNKTKSDAMEIFENALRNVAPDVEVKTRRIGGANYQIPVAVMGNRKSTLGLRWIIDAARAKKGLQMSQKLADEIIEASQGRGNAVKKRDDVYKMAESNRAFAHFLR
ncbi:30S ribosomal protein S7 [Candidatus Parcubacteria bacterium]|nr:MAG: 30S ribosomal protein S7 [Candidatus Parcubacteria bacterium]